ncbi:hypothetical protein RUX70_004110 [Vibrio vulnificus]|uniref:hypothetical protein n=1 Tax=Vibrio vulnificus TaxID=672 RepID=UPI000735BF38|nr:hypothetical protein [Vibrio vulnificus]ELK2038029.1 hypothetical protein [Vibrio vulnificus]ELK2283829.1 hypothetical protein [Vibrio vulnificus]PNM58870.1 hypothetical protein AL546_009650 [Vibrio vulnificus]SUP14009.1 Uncharacterised protein [Vibrio vulnificus]
MTNDNPAARLLAILNEGKKINSQTAAKSTWKEILKVPNPNSPQSEAVLMAKLGQFMVLPYETKQLVEQYYPAQSNDINHAVTQIQHALTHQNLSDKWQTFIGKIDSHTMSTLSMTSALLDHSLNTKLIEDDKLDELKEKISSLLNEVMDTDLPAEFKKFITHYLRKIRNAIEDYFVSGAIPILDALEATLGHAVLDPEFRDNLVKTPAGNKIRDTLSDLANVVAVAAAATGAATYLLEKGIPLLG